MLHAHVYVGQCSRSLEYRREQNGSETLTDSVEMAPVWMETESVWGTYTCAAGDREYLGKVCRNGGR